MEKFSHMTWKKINIESKNLLQLLTKNLLNISFAESCTGGMISSAIIHNPGSSNILNNSYITYSNESKIKELGVTKQILSNFGSVSQECCLMMLNGLLKKTKANVGIAVTGIAGPGGSSKEKPVGTVWVGYGSQKKQMSKKFIFAGNRLEVRLQTTLISLQKINKFIVENYP